MLEWKMAQINEQISCSPNVATLELAIAMLIWVESQQDAHKMLLYLSMKYMEISNNYGGNWAGKVSHKTGKLDWY